MPRHRRDVRVGIPGGPRVRHRRRGRAHIGQHRRRTQRAPLLLRRRAETGPGVLQGTTFEDQAHRLPGNRRDLRRQPGRRRAPCTYRPRPSARPFATERPSPGSISTMETNRSRLRSSSSRSSPNAVRALCRWLPRLGPPRGTRVARTVASGPDARYNRCGR